MAKRTALDVHVFVADPTLGTDHRGRKYCRRCPLPEGHKVHTMPGQSREVSEVESRKLGERNEDK